MLNGSEAISGLPDTAPPDPVYRAISEARRAVTTDLKMRTKRTWDDVGRAMENLVNCEPTTSRGLRALTSFLRQYPPLAEILRSGDASGLKNLFTILDLAAQRLA